MNVFIRVFKRTACMLTPLQYDGERSILSYYNKASSE